MAEQALPDMAAAELALGVLDGAERAEALRRLLAEPAFAREVDGWRERLAPLLDEVPAAAPSDNLWLRIVDALDRGGSDDTVLKRSVARWKTMTAGVSAVAAALVGWIAVDLSRPPDIRYVERPAVTADAEAAPDAAANAPQAGPMMIAQLAPANAGPMAIAAVMPDGALKISPGPMAGPDKSPELWVIPAGGKPVSLGLVRPGEMNTLRISAELRPMLNGEAVLAISIEPRGGSPTGQPTGPVVATGKITTI